MSDKASSENKKPVALGASERNAYQVSDGVVDLRRMTRPVKTARLAARSQNLIFDANRAALVIIDMQNDFCAPEGWMSSLGADLSASKAIIPAINHVSTAFRAQEAPVIWLNWGVRPDRLNLPPATQHPFNPDGTGPGLAGRRESRRGAYHVLQEGGWGADIVEGLDVAASDIYVSKHRISGFWDTPLDSILRNLNITSLFFTGVNSDHCVLGTQMDANFLGYDTVMVEDGVATTSPQYCTDATLANVRFCFGFTTTSGELVKAMREIA